MKKVADGPTDILTGHNAELYLNMIYL